MKGEWEEGAETLTGGALMGGSYAKKEEEDDIKTLRGVKKAIGKHIALCLPKMCVC